jgi:hypothetical protein
MPKPKVTAAQKVAGSDLATAATARHEFLTLGQAATLADVEDDPEALKALVAAAQQGPGSFEHVASRLRETAAERAVLAEARTRLEESGLAITGRPENTAPCRHQTSTAVRHRADRAAPPTGIPPRPTTEGRHQHRRRTHPAARQKVMVSGATRR